VHDEAGGVVIRRLIGWLVCDDATSAMLTVQDRTAPGGSYRPTWQAPWGWSR